MKKRYTLASVLVLLVFTLVGASTHSVACHYLDDSRSAAITTAHSSLPAAVIKTGKTVHFKIAAKGKIKVRYRARYFTTDFGRRLAPPKQIFPDKAVSVRDVHHTSGQFSSLLQLRGPPSI
jgi:hypothetical protein